MRFREISNRSDGNKNVVPGTICNATVSPSGLCSEAEPHRCHMREMLLTAPFSWEDWWLPKAKEHQRWDRNPEFSQTELRSHRSPTITHETSHLVLPAHYLGKALSHHEEGLSSKRTPSSGLWTKIWAGISAQPLFLDSGQSATCLKVLCVIPISLDSCDCPLTDEVRKEGC